MPLWLSPHHGERLWILDTRRRFVRVRTGTGAEGWVDATQLLTPEEMAQIRKDTATELALPSEGSAGVFEALNVHIDPSRVSPAFARIPEGGSVDVLAHKLVPKAQGPAKIPTFTVQRPQPTKRERKKKEVKVTFPLPRLAPPGPPPNLAELSRGRVEEPVHAAAKPAAAAAPVALESWTLIRTKDQQVGWVLSRNLMMSIPDEVAQYAEGKHITSYFSLGQVQDEEKGLKNNWLWTTAASQEDFDFDSWRVFLWNRRRHRYETSYRERDVEGYFPVHVDAADGTAGRRIFQLIMKDEDGRLYQRSYEFDGVRVHLTGKEPVTPDGQLPPSAGNGSPQAAPQGRSRWLKDWLSNFQRKLSPKH